MSENPALDKFIETAKATFNPGDAEILEYPNVKMYKLLFIDVLIPKKLQKNTEDLTAIAEALAPLADREPLPEAEAFISRDGRLAINVKPRKVS